jgi:hypothetical protein
MMAGNFFPIADAGDSQGDATTTSARDIHQRGRNSFRPASNRYRSKEVVMKRSFSATFALLAALTVPVPLSAKGSTVKITIVD